MGAKLYAWLGGLALFLAAAYFVKYSFEHNLIPPWVRVTLGFVLGGGLVVGGYRMKQRAYLVTSQTLCATGVVILYAVTFACRSVYHFSLFGPSFLTRVITQMYFPGDPLIPLDPIANSVGDPKALQRMIARFDLATTEPEWALGYQFDFVLRGRAMTPFEEPHHE